MGGRIELALSTAILLEDEEVGAAMHGPVFAREVMNFLDLATASGFVRHCTPQFDFRIIAADPDDDISRRLRRRRRRGILHHRSPSLQGTARCRPAGCKPQPIPPEEFIREFLSPS